MKAATKELEAHLNAEIDATLKRWAAQEEMPSDGFNIISWARKGWLVRA